MTEHPAADSLARLALDTRETGAVKLAVGDDFLTGVGEAVRTDPRLRAALLGGGVGAGLGGLAGAARNALRPRDERKPAWQSALAGGAAGAGLGALAAGGAAAAGRDPGADVQQGIGRATGALDTVARGIGHRLAKEVGPRPTPFAIGGQNYTVAPDLLKQDPALLGRLQELTKDPRGPAGALLKTKDWVAENFDDLPTGSEAVLPLAGAATLINSRTVGLGEGTGLGLGRTGRWLQRRGVGWPGRQMEGAGNWLGERGFGAMPHAKFETYMPRAVGQT
jgi:hypothetical protein